MKMKCVAVRDRMLAGFSQPMFFATSAAAERAFKDELNRQDGPFYKHPEDFELFELGEFDDQTGMIVCLEQPRALFAGQKRQALQ